MFERQKDLLCVAVNFLEVQGAFAVDIIFQRDAADELHDNVFQIILDRNVVNVDDIGM